MVSFHRVSPESRQSLTQNLSQNPTQSLAQNFDQNLGQNLSRSLAQRLARSLSTFSRDFHRMIWKRVVYPKGDPECTTVNALEQGNHRCCHNNTGSLMLMERVTGVTNDLWSANSTVHLVGWAARLTPDYYSTKFRFYWAASFAKIATWFLTETSILESFCSFTDQQGLHKRKCYFYSFDQKSPRKWMGLQNKIFTV